MKFINIKHTMLKLNTSEIETKPIGNFKYLTYCCIKVK